MGKNHYWIGYQRQDDTIEVTIKDSSGARIESWEINMNDKKAGTKMMRMLKEKYNFSPEIPSEKSINKDLDWLKKSRGF